MPLNFLLLILSFFVLIQQCHCLYNNDAESKVVVIDTIVDFERQVLQSDGIWMVQFFSPTCGHCQGFAPRYEQLAHIVNDIVHIGAVDASTTDGHALAQQYKVAGLPTMYIFGFDKSNPQMYQGSRDAIGMGQMLISAIMETINARSKGQAPRNNGPSKVVELTQDNFDELVLHKTSQAKTVSMVAFVAPWCPHCERLLPEWTEAAHRLAKDANDTILMGVVDATLQTDLAAKYARGYPTIRVFVNSDKGNDADKEPMNYRGERGSDHIYDYAMAVLARYGSHNDDAGASSPLEDNESSLPPQDVCNDVGSEL